MNVNPKQQKTTEYGIVEIMVSTTHHVVPLSPRQFEIPTHIPLKDIFVTYKKTKDEYPHGAAPYWIEVNIPGREVHPGSNRYSYTTTQKEFNDMNTFLDMYNTLNDYYHANKIENLKYKKKERKSTNAIMDLEL